MILTGSLVRAARALVEWPRERVAELSGLPVEVVSAFERGNVDPGDEARAAIVAVLERGGAVFLPEEGGHGAGVRLRFTAKDIKQLTRLENEGGLVGDDDV